VPVFRASSLLPVLIAAGLALAAAIACTAMRPANHDLYLLDAVFSPDDQGESLESDEPVEYASPDLHGSTMVGHGPSPLEETPRTGRLLPQPFSIAGDRPRARLPDRGVDLYPVPGSSRLLATLRFDRLLLTRLDGGAASGRAFA
jgi:hypothetical protein